MNNLATLYEKGYGVAQNYSQAGQLYEASARRGNAQGASAVARFMASGAGTKQNIAQAWAWANIAIQNGDNDAKSILGEISTLASATDIEEGKKALEKLKEELAKTASSEVNSETTSTPAPEPQPKGDKPKEDKPKEAKPATATKPPVSATTPPVSATTPPVGVTPPDETKKK
jgi:TPR repeat protein